jgi:ABC-2 type transport system ATP-binding protein
MYGVRELTLRYADVVALRDVSLVVPSGRLTALVGGDGAGKTSLLETFAGFRAANSGTIARPAPHRRSFVTASGGCYADLTVEENLDFVSSVFRIEKDRGQSRRLELVERAGLSGALHRRADRLSGGMRQKLSVIMALLPDPELLLLDEPTTGLDPLSRTEIWRLLVHAANGGAAVLFSTTYLEEAERAHAICLLQAGTVLGVGSTTTLRKGFNGKIYDSDGERPLHAHHVWRRGRRFRWCAFDEDELRANTSFSAIEPDLEDLVIGYELQTERTPSPPDLVYATADGGTRQRPPISLGLAVQTRSLTKRYGEVCAVDDVSVDIRHGEVVGLLGANGAGKSTLIKMILGLTRPTSGEVKVDATKHGSSQSQTFGYVPQNIGMYVDLTVRENVQFTASAYNAEAAGEDLLRNFDGSPDILVREIPLGLQRLLAFDVARLHNPRLLILDEPTSGMGPLQRARAWDSIRASADEGVAILISTHYMDEAMQCDRLLIMANGKVVGEGDPEQIVANMKVARVTTNRVADALEVLDAEGFQPVLSGDELRVPSENLEALRSALQSQGIESTVQATNATLAEAILILGGAGATPVVAS